MALAVYKEYCHHGAPGAMLPPGAKHDGQDHDLSSPGIPEEGRPRCQDSGTLAHRADPRGTPYIALRKPRGPALLEGGPRSSQGAGAAVGRPVELRGYRPLLPRDALRPRRSSLTRPSSSNGSRPVMRIS